MLATIGVRSGVRTRIAAGGSSTLPTTRSRTFNVKRSNQIGGARPWTALTIAEAMPLVVMSQANADLTCPKAVIYCVYKSLAARTTLP
jgi:hypothetical protein